MESISSIIKFREINKNKSIGFTFPKKVSNYFKLKKGTFKSKCCKKDGKFIIEIDLNDLLNE